MIKIKDVEQSMLKVKLPSDVVCKVVSDLQKLEESKKASKGGDPKGAKKYVVLDFGNGTGLPIQIMESEEPSSVIVKIQRAANLYNLSKKGQKLGVKSIAEAVELIPRKYSVAESFWAKSKVPVQILVSDNKL